MITPGVETMLCSVCGEHVSDGSAHRHRRDVSPGVQITAATRYRIKGRISPADRAGKQYDVDLVVESIP